MNMTPQNRVFILGAEYSIVDMAAWGWIDRYPMVLGKDALDELPHLKRWYESIDARPAVARAKSIGQNIQFKTAFDEETLRSMFPQNYPKV
jgi:GSH-dependent disulfide-bond oxidoreductase